MLKKIFSSELGKGAFILFITINLFFFLNFVFHLSMGRLLGPIEYGVLATLMSIVYLFGAPTEAIQNIISRYTSTLNLKKKQGQIKFLLFKSLKKGFIISVFLFILASIAAILLSYFLKINFWLLVLTNLFIFSSFSLPVIRGVLQGRKKFSLLGIGMVSESIIKLTFAIFLVFIGFHVFGAVVGVLIGVLASFIFSFYFNKDILNKKQEEISFNEIYKTSIPYFVCMLVILLIFSIDIILARFFFVDNPELVGNYAVLSMMGKMIFFGTMAIGKTMFPLTSEKHDNNQDSSDLFKKSFLIVLFLCLITILFYAFFPRLIIFILYGKQYINMAPFLIYSAIAFSFLSLTNLILLYRLSTNKIKKTSLLLILFMITPLLFYLYHNTILEYMLAFMVSNIIMFIGALFFIK